MTVSPVFLSTVGAQQKSGRRSVIAFAVIGGGLGGILFFIFLPFRVWLR